MKRFHNHSLFFLSCPYYPEKQLIPIIVLFILITIMVSFRGRFENGFFKFLLVFFPYSS
uniref:Uncharacterized protein n=1 Tax=Heterorhabditis bacteriophora TaxID=37862 RepID=A0A1I7WKG2_HETBA